MEMFMTVFSEMLNPANFLIIVGGTILGIIFGAVPGLSATTGIALMLLIITLNIVGDGLRDALDPRLRGKL